MYIIFFVTLYPVVEKEKYMYKEYTQYKLHVHVYSPTRLEEIHTTASGVLVFPIDFLCKICT